MRCNDTRLRQVICSGLSKTTGNQCGAAAGPEARFDTKNDDAGYENDATFSESQHRSKARNEVVVAYGMNVANQKLIVAPAAQGLRLLRHGRGKGCPDQKCLLSTSLLELGSDLGDYCLVGEGMIERHLHWLPTDT